MTLEQNNGELFRLLLRAQGGGPEKPASTAQDGQKVSTKMKATSSTTSTSTTSTSTSTNTSARTSTLRLLSFPSGSLVILSGAEGALKATLVSKPTMVTTDVTKTVEALSRSFLAVPGATLWPWRVSEELNGLREGYGKGRILVKTL